MNRNILPLSLAIALLLASLAVAEKPGKALRDRAQRAFSGLRTANPQLVTPSTVTPPTSGYDRPTTPLATVQAATVQIEVYDRSGSRRSSGSGFIVDSSGIVVTNNHVLNNAGSILVKLSNGDSFKDVTVRDFNEVKDIAIIKVAGFDLPTAKLGNSNQVKEGGRILTCGNTLGDYANTVSDGLISGFRQHPEGYRYIQISAPISPGNSGGPVFREDGSIIGIATAARRDGQNVNFAVPINYVIGMLENDRKLSLEQYSGVCGEGMDHIVRKADEGQNLAHPDSDICRRIVVIPFSGFSQQNPTTGTDIMAALILRLKSNFASENLYFVDHEFIQKTMRETSGDRYDAMLKDFDVKRAKEFAVKFRANTVIFGKINHFESGIYTEWVPFVGITNVLKAIMNLDWSIYKLDVDKAVMNGS